MASDKAIITALLETVRELFKTDLDALSVNNVRKIVEEKLDLSLGFLKSNAWKAKSKELITGEVAKLDEGNASAPESPAPAPAPEPKSKPAPEPKVTKKPEPVKKGTKRAAPAKAAAPKKRQKKEVTPSSSDEELSEPEESEEEASFSDSDVSEAPKSKRGGGRGKKGKVETESEEESEAEETPSEVDSDASEAPKRKTAKPKTKAAPKRASTASRKSSERVVSEDEEEETAAPVKPNPVVVARSKPLPTVEKPDAEGDEKPDTTNQAAEGSDSDLSVLIDEPPKRARSSGSKSAKPSTSKAPKAAPALSPTDAEIKTLQSQLVKCGIRKIWQFELKDYGDDSKAKIKHLKGMLKEVGMEGRFSEARAREIKEMRELAQDVEAVTEGAKLWGKRGRRSEGKKAAPQEEAGSESEEESEEEVKPARRAARKADLAFLGDESDSD
ncbi:hypothetical protein VE03_03365 [Pseudogymnoascus sp. 23342-1-I1]|nr:hypothetical protein VE03_03365 [Pseudogymnoascus sp. 23342-1-I1]